MEKKWLLVDVDAVYRALIAAPLTARHALPILGAIGIDAESSALLGFRVARRKGVLSE